MLASVLLAALLAGPNPYLQKAKEQHVALEFERCLESLALAARWDNSTQERATIEVYEGLCRFSLGRKKEAADRFELALRIDPSVELPPLTSPIILKLFERVKAKLPPEETPSPAETPPAPVAEPIAAPAPPPAVEQPAAPPRSPAGAVVLGALALGSTVTGILFGVSASSSAAASRDPVTLATEVSALASRARSQALIANVSYAVAGAFALGALVWTLVLLATR